MHEKDNYLKTAELSTEQNCNMIDGVPNNTPIPPTPPELDAKPLTEKQMEDYELKPAPGNPDRVRPSITARLKDETRGQEPPKEPGQKRSHKNHEER